MTTLSLSDLKKKIVHDPAWDSLNEQQKAFCLSVLDKNNVFLTGSAGVGKSFVLNFLFKFLTKNNINIGKTATTGAAALNIGGSTIHSYSGIGLADTDFINIIKGVYRNKKASNRILYTQILFIDEISMCSGRLLGIIDQTFKKIRRNKLPFGGVVFVASGDFCQLPPIEKSLTDNSPDFCFKSYAWKNADIKTIHLREILRQKDDKKFAELLEKVRFGNNEDVDLLYDRVNVKLETPKDIQPIRLFGYNKSVDAYNTKVLSSIKEKSIYFYAKDNGDQRHIDFFDKNCQAAKKIEVKKGCQVMLLYNIDTERGLINGSVGTICGIESNFPVVDFGKYGKILIEPQEWTIKEQYVQDEQIKYRVVAKRIQVPLKVAYACSYHKAQGSTLDFAIVDANQAFNEGMLYVAISRVKSLSGLSISSYFDPDKIQANQECVKFYKNL